MPHDDYSQNYLFISLVFSTFEVFLKSKSSSISETKYKTLLMSTTSKKSSKLEKNHLLTFFDTQLRNLFFLYYIKQKSYLYVKT